MFSFLNSLSVLDISSLLGVELLKLFFHSLFGHFDQIMVSASISLGVYLKCL